MLIHVDRLVTEPSLRAPLKRNIEYLQVSIQTLGCINPIRVKALPKKRFWHRRKYVVKDGNMRLTALKLLGYKRIPCIVE